MVLPTLTMTMPLDGELLDKVEKLPESLPRTLKVADVSSLVENESSLAMGGVHTAA